MPIKLPPYLFWLTWVRKMAWDPFWWVILFLIILWIPFLRVWWWVFLPLMLSMQAKTLYTWWITWDYQYFNKLKWKMLEIIPPKEVLAPYKVMEDVFSVIWPLYDIANSRERWVEGEFAIAPFWCSWEIASIEGKIHFYVRVLRQHRLVIESTLYGHFPEIEIYEVPDYTKNVPLTLPNEEWDLYGEDWYLRRDDCLPIKTYEKFFEPQGERITAEEKRMDPILSLLESMAKLGPGENYWLQFITTPITDYDDDWRKNAETMIAKLSKREEKKEPTLFEDLGEVFRDLIMGPQKEGTGEKATYKWVSQTKSDTAEREMVITPGEREVLSEVENKKKKWVFKVSIRGVYVAKRENWRAPHRVLARGYFAHFSSVNLNELRYDPDTRPKVQYFWRKRRSYLRARKMLRNYTLRLPSGFPDMRKYCCILNIEEMGTLVHFPIRVTGMITPTLTKIESKKAGPPPNLPTE